MPQSEINRIGWTKHCFPISVCNVWNRNNKAIARWDAVECCKNYHFIARYPNNGKRRGTCSEINRIIKIFLKNNFKSAGNLVNVHLNIRSRDEATKIKYLNL